MTLLSEQGAKLGTLEPLVPSSGGALSKHKQVMSFCTHFDGSYTDTLGAHQMVDVGGRYRLQVSLVGPVALADAARNVTPRVDVVGLCAMLGMDEQVGFGPPAVDFIYTLNDSGGAE